MIAFDKEYSPDRNSMGGKLIITRSQEFTLFKRKLENFFEEKFSWFLSENKLNFCALACYS